MSKNLSVENKNYFNRELSLIKFNYRVLEEALNRDYPILERLRFLYITFKNIDEFISVRIGKLVHEINSNEKSLDDLTGSQQLPVVLLEVEDLFSKQQAVFIKIKKELGKYDIEFDSPSEVEEGILNTFIQNIKEKISKINPIKFAIEDKINQASLLDAKDFLVVKTKTQILFYPFNLEPFFVYRDVNLNFVSVKAIVLEHFDKIFQNEKEITNIFFISVVRNADIDFVSNSDELDSIEDYEKLFLLRDVSKILFLKLEGANEEEKKFTAQKFGLPLNQVTIYNNLSFIKNAENILNYDYKAAAFDLNKLFFEPIKIRFPERIADFNGNYFDAIDAKDILIHHPYESFDMVNEFIKAAAYDVNVTEIKQTLYRTAKDSAIIKSLIEAKKNGKNVICFIEVKARFDEKRNISFIKELKKNGIEVIFSKPDTKTHIKLTLIKKVKKENGIEKEKIYAHFGTGNYNSDTARVYSDLSLFTSVQDICQELNGVFDYIKTDKIPQNLNKVFLSPYNFRSKILDLIDAEIKNIKNDKPAGIWLKVNSITDKQIIDKLYEASKAGVKIELIVRGICCLKPQVKGLSENIKVKSIIGRFLEHARVYCFASGFAFGSRYNKVFIASSDLMTRNMDSRIEAAIPIENETVFEQILGQIIQANISDKRNSWYLDETGKYKRSEFDANSISAHQYFINNPSLSGRGSAIHSVRYLEEISKTIVDDTQKPQQLAVIDIGSNSIRMVIYDGLKRFPSSIMNEKKQCGLIKDFINTGKLNEKGVKEALAIIPRFLRIIETMKIQKIYAIATSAVREASDGQTFIKEVKRRFNLEIQVISEKEEAKFSTLGVISSLTKVNGVVGDLGGGSLELANVDYEQGSENIFKEEGYYKQLISLPLGALRLFDFAANSSSKKLQSFIQENLAKFPLKACLENKTFYAVGGSLRSIASVDMYIKNYPLNIVDNYEVESKSLLPTLKKIIDNKKIVRKVSRAKKREDMMPFAAKILFEIITIGKPKNIIFSSSGVREGILFNDLSPAVKAQDPLFVAVYDIVANFTPIHFHTSKNKPWIDFSLELAAWINNIIKNESPEILRIKNAASILAWIAWHEINTFRAEVSFRWVLDSKLPTLSHKQRAFLAICIYYRYADKYSHIMDKVKNILSADDYKKAMNIGLMMRLGFKLTGGAVGILSRTKIAIENKNLNIVFHPSDRCLISSEFLEAFEKLATNMGLKHLVR